MCGRYYVDPDFSDLAVREAIEALNRRSDKPVKTGEIFPGDSAPVLARSRSGRVMPFLMRWGYRTEWMKTVINARSETAAHSPLFSDGMARRRCLIPATRYFEWEKRGGERVKYGIRPVGDGSFYLAGIYRFEENAPVFAVLTREASDCVRFIHDRMPVIFAGGDADAWLDAPSYSDELLANARTDMSYSQART